MNRLFVVLGITFVAIGLSMAGCAPSAQQVTPTKAPAATTKPAEPTKAPAAAAKPAEPTIAPAAKVDYPQKGKTVNVIVPFAAGGSTDVGARMTAALLEKQLGVPFQIVNKGGAGTQIGMTDLVRAAPDGYTIAITALPSAVTAYLDRERKAIYSRKDIQVVAGTFTDPVGIAVPSGSRLKTLKDLNDEAKAKPNTISVATSGIMSVVHIPMLQLEELAQVRFAYVHFDGGGPGVTALLGGHVDVQSSTSSQLQSLSKSGQVRFLALLDKQESRFLPGVPTAESLGWKVYSSTSHWATVPAGTPKEIVNILDGAIKTVLESNELKKWANDNGLETRYTGLAEASAFWDNADVELKAVMPLSQR